MQHRFMAAAPAITQNPDIRFSDGCSAM